MMTCKELIDFLMDYTDGRLTPEVRAEFERHLKVCPSCVAYLDSYQRTVSLTKDCLGGGPDEQAVPPAVPQALVRAILEARKKQG